MVRGSRVNKGRKSHYALDTGAVGVATIATRFESGSVRDPAYDGSLEIGIYFNKGQLNHGRSTIEEWRQDLGL